ncbi:MAG: RdgB/HAM1 family non-canonical purine NTP pyrophosphatase [Candidatus Paracaedimonas acanthamoebae]|uniref:dITP/XTP pyrophosphatase n=1 Tax=Candidatus Paracaedimonas acanthamoebae TaxID=244581 RepID=A0A8J7PL29_9PROT|nr:RdgB/HAM1 family non-canonical purine NTP pyrophosphatase [Candidatus Paracaedimonas acanthamoebae]
MARKFTESQLVIASHNQGKIEEITQLFSPFNIKLSSSAALGLVEPEETGGTYLKNALLKARACVTETGLPALSDDSGLEVEALDGNPGVDTAPYAKALGGYDKVFDLWANHPEIQKNVKASFYCVQVLLWPDGHQEVFEGRVRGRLTFPPRGIHGHGYDPIFIPEGCNQTVAEMPLIEKNKVSHRFLALQQLIESCFK